MTDLAEVFVHILLTIIIINGPQLGNLLKSAGSNYDLLEVCFHIPRFQGLEKKMHEDPTLGAAHNVQLFALLCVNFPQRDRKAIGITYCYRCRHD